MNTADKIKVMQAFEDGEKVRYRKRGSVGFEIIDFSFPIWDWGTYEYEIVPEPKVIYVNEYENVRCNGIYDNKERAENGALGNNGTVLRTAVKYIEVVE